MRVPSLYVIAMVAGSALPLAAQQEANTGSIAVAVKEFEGRGLSESEATTLTDVFSSYLIETGRFRIMERAQMNEILKEQGFQRSGACTDAACMVEMGQLLGVESIVTGSVGKLGETYTVSARLVSVETGEIVHTVSKFHKGEIDQLLTDVLPLVAREIAGQGKAVEAAADHDTQDNARGKRDREEAKPTNRKRRTWLWVGAGTVLVGGGALAVVLILNGDDDTSDQDLSTGDVYLTWQ
ncbi:MAG: hypothetical protein GF331_02735 [Chitinivibrionales bacterium]|nr:hypothetical protein [Chitinivibrionales bacterium]